MRENAAEKKYLIELSEEFGVPLSMLYKPQNISPVDINNSVNPNDENRKREMPDDGEILQDDPDDPNTDK